MERKIRRMKLKLLSLIVIGFTLVTFSSLIVVVLLQTFLPELLTLPLLALLVAIAATSLPLIALGLKLLIHARNLASEYRGLKQFKNVAFSPEELMESITSKMPRVYIWDDLGASLNARASDLALRYSLVFADIKRLKRINLVGLILSVGTVLACFGWFIWISFVIGLDFVAITILAVALGFNYFQIRKFMRNLRGAQETERMARSAYEEDVRR